MIGVTVTKYLGRIPAFWADYSENDVINIIQSDNSGRVPNEKMYSDITYTNGTTKVVVADGVWFCLDKTRTNTIQFDTKYSGFHFYDHDICMQVHSTGKEIHVINDIIIEHFSWGAISHSWANNAFLFYKKWQSHLPEESLGFITVEMGGYYKTGNIGHGFNTNYLTKATWIK